jgi:hypothetical protein
MIWFDYDRLLEQLVDSAIQTKKVNLGARIRVERLRDGWEVGIGKAKQGKTGRHNTTQLKTRHSS